MPSLLTTASLVAALASKADRNALFDAALQVIDDDYGRAAVGLVGCFQEQKQQGQVQIKAPSRSITICRCRATACSPVAGPVRQVATTGGVCVLGRERGVTIARQQQRIVGSSREVRLAVIDVRSRGALLSVIVLGPVAAASLNSVRLVVPRLGM